jgi:hypothetical protein
MGKIGESGTRFFVGPTLVGFFVRINSHLHKHHCPQSPTHPPHLRFSVSPFPRFSPSSFQSGLATPSLLPSFRLSLFNSLNLNPV